MPSGERDSIVYQGSKEITSSSHDIVLEYDTFHHILEMIDAFNFSFLVVCCSGLAFHNRSKMPHYIEYEYTRRVKAEFQ